MPVKSYEDPQVQQAAGAIIFHVSGLNSANQAETDKVDQRYVSLMNGDKLKTNYRKDLLGDDPYVFDITPVYGNNEYSGPRKSRCIPWYSTCCWYCCCRARNCGLEQMV
jgi:hypothetical protein